MPNECGITLRYNDRQKRFHEDTNAKVLHQNAAFLKGRKSLCECLGQRKNALRRITPINEETEEQIAHEWRPSIRASNVGCWNMSSCPDTEIFKSKTTIKYANSKTTSKTPATPKQPEVDPTPKVSSTENKAVQTVCNSLLRSRRHDSIHLYQCGNLMMSDSSSAYKDFVDNCHTFKRKRRKFENFYWLLRPFRGKYRKSHKSDKIQAIVCKTYFVKWTKPPDPLIYGYGVRRPQAQVTVLRRCRSAIF